MKEKTQYSEYEQNLYRQFVTEYLTGNSVEKLTHHYPISQAQGYRILDQFGIIKSAGRRHSNLGKALYFFAHLAHSKLPLETLYYHYTPSLIKEAISPVTLHRILQNIKLSITRTNGTALIISTHDNPNEILVANDNTPSNSYLGKNFGAISLPMTYSINAESPRNSILRVLQQEVFTNHAINQELTLDLIDYQTTPLTNIAIADVNVQVFLLKISTGINFSSPKLSNHRFINVQELATQNPLSPNIRSGVVEIVRTYHDFINSSIIPEFQTSELNLALNSLTLPK